MTFRTAAALTAAYREGRATPRQVAERALNAAAAFDRREPAMRIFIALDAADVRAQADAATERWRAGRPLSPLDGVPIAIKDEYDVRGYGTTVGTSFLGKTPAQADALAVARLRQAGAILFGKTNMHEFGVAPSGINIHHGAARNPYDPARDTGGSSSGSGAAVASGLVPIALGNDGGGSIRVPAALCGVAGIKGTWDRVPTDGVPLLCWSLEHAGPLGATVEDVCACFGVITGEDVTLPPVPSPLRVGVCESWWEPADPAVSRAVRAALERVGATIVPVTLPHVKYSVEVGGVTFIGEGAASVEPHLLADAPMAPSVRINFEVGRALPAATYVKAQRIRTLLARDFDRALETVDVIVTPTTVTTAPRYHEDAFESGELDEATVKAMVHFTFATNLTGLPSAQVPCGYDEAGLPIGMQIIGRHGEDLTTLAVAAAVEKVTERRLPSVWVDLLG